MGPLSGIKILEFQGIGPGPFCAMMLSDMGAELVRIDRSQNVNPEASGGAFLDFLARGRRSAGIDLKHPEGIETCLRMIERADAIIEGYRPGVMERLGLGPEVCLERNPRLVYGRMTGWGQEGPMAQAAGHDINYIALAGVLAHLGRRGFARRGVEVGDHDPRALRGETSCGREADARRAAGDDRDPVLESLRQIDGHGSSRWIEGR